MPMRTEKGGLGIKAQINDNVKRVDPLRYIQHRSSSMKQSQTSKQSKIVREYRRDVTKQTIYLTLAICFVNK